LVLDRPKEDLRQIECVCLHPAWSSPSTCHWPKSKAAQRDHPSMATERESRSHPGRPRVR
jgi:hypothetical protein